MDAESLRSIYNKRFSSEKNIWSSTSLTKTKKVARRTKQWLKKLGYDKSGGKLLDVGCAKGYYTEAFRLSGLQVTGLDYAEVVLDQARVEFPQCEFIHMNGFEPVFQRHFDIIFCKGFSGANTHDLDFIASWINKYISHLSPGGFFILSSLSDFSGKEKEGETVNLSKKEIQDLTQRINASFRGIYIFNYFGLISQLKKQLQRILFKKVIKEDFYIFLQKT